MPTYLTPTAAQIAARGPGYLTLGSSTTPSTGAGIIQFSDDAKVMIEPVYDALRLSTQGIINQTLRDEALKISGTPIAYSPSQAAIMSFLWPFAGSVPVIGSSLFNPGGAADYPVIWAANSLTNDLIAGYRAAVPKPPDLTLLPDKAIVGPLEVVGIAKSGTDPGAQFSTYKPLPGAGAWSEPSLLQSGDLLGRQRYSCSWPAGNTKTGNATYTNFMPEKGATIRHVAEYSPYLVQGRIADYVLASYYAMVEMIPVGPSMSDLEQCLGTHGSSSASQGSLLSTATGDLTISGQFGFTGVIKNAALFKGGFAFGAVPLRSDVWTWVGTYSLITAGSPTGGLNLS